MARSHPRMQKSYFIRCPYVVDINSKIAIGVGKTCNGDMREESFTFADRPCVLGESTLYLRLFYASEESPDRVGPVVLPCPLR